MYYGNSLHSNCNYSDNRKVVVLNKFLQLEGRINTLIDIIPQLKIEADTLTPEARKTYDEVLLHHAEAGSNES